MEPLVTVSVVAAAAALRRGGLAAFPTETVYGLGALAEDERAVRRIYEAKGRPSAHPVIVHVADLAAAERYARLVPAEARALAVACWPGPLTLVLPRRSTAGDWVTGGRDGVALRVPSHPVALALLREVACGVAAPSANRFGRVSATTAAHVVEELGGVLRPGTDVVLDGGACPVGVESTIVDCSGPVPVLLRPGGVTGKDLDRILGTDGWVVSGTGSEGSAPGTLPSHYAPLARVVLAEPAEASSALGALVAGHGVGSVGVIVPADRALRPDVRVLARPRDGEEYAALLYAALRHADALRLTAVLAVLPPAAGIGTAVRDRLGRAARGSAAEH